MYNHISSENDGRAAFVSPCFVTIHIATVRDKRSLTPVSYMDDYEVNLVAGSLRCEDGVNVCCKVAAPLIFLHAQPLVKMWYYEISNAA